MNPMVGPSRMTSKVCAPETRSLWGAPLRAAQQVRSRDARATTAHNRDICREVAG